MLFLADIIATAKIVMSSRRHIYKKLSSQSASTPVTNPFKTRGFGNGMQARVAKLPETNLLQTRPIAPPYQELSQPPDTRSVEEQMEGAAQFGYNTSDIPVQAPEAPPPPPPIQSKMGGWYQPPIQRANPVLNQLNLLREEQSSQPETEEQQDVSMRHSSSGIGEETAGTQNQLAQAESNQWQTIDISAAIKYNQTRYSQETITVIQHRLGVAITGEFNEETVLAIAKWQQEKKLAEIDGKIGYGTRESLGITQRLFDDKKGYGVDYFPGQPFVGEVGDQDQIDPNDVAQGDLGNCYFSAAMVAVARANPSLIRELIKDNGDGSYNVTLYTEKGSQIIKVTPYFPATGQGPAYAGFGDESELWPMLLEKAYAQYTEGYGETGKGAGGYDLIGEGGRPGDAVKVLTGPIPQEYKEKYQVEDVYWVKEVDWRELVRGINLSLKENWAVTAVTIDPPDGEGKIPKEGKKKIGEQGIYFDHAYVIDAIYRTEEGELTPDNVFLNLLNPWGKEHIQGLSIRLFQEYFATLYINPISQRNVDQKVPVTQAESASQSESKPVAQMEVWEKIGAAISVAIKNYLAAEAAARLKALLNPTSLAVIAGVLAAWAASHAVGVGQVVDVILIGVGIVTLGLDVISVIEDLIGFAGVLNAQNQEDIDQAAKHLAEAIATVGVEVVLQLLTSRLAGMKGKKPELDEAGVPRRRGVFVEEELTHLSTRDGHELIVTRGGNIFRCSSCQDISQWYAEVLAQNPALAQRLEELQTRYRQIAEMEPGARRNNLQQQADRELTQLENDLQEADSIWGEAYEPSDWAKDTAEHAWSGHQGDFVRIGINNKEEAARLIDDIVTSRRETWTRNRNGVISTAYWDENTGILVIDNPSQPTAFSPDIPYDEYLTINEFIRD